MHIPTIPTPDPDHLQTLLDRHTAAAVVGRVGLGKTGLLRALEARWEGPVFRVHYNRAEAGTDYSGIDVLLASLGAPSIEDAAAVPDAVLSALRAAELPDDGLIVILGADKMDRPSQDVLGQWLRRSQSGRTRMVISVNALPTDSPLAPLPTVELRELDHGELVALAQEECGGGLSEAAAHVAAAASSGLPLALRHILDAMNRRERLGELPLTIPPRPGAQADALVRDIVGTPDADTQSLLRLLALAPSTPCGPLAARVDGFWEIVDDLEMRDLVERRDAHLRLTNGLVRAWTHQTMSATERIAGHVRLAEDCAGVDPRLAHWHASFSRPTEDSAPTLIADARLLIREGMTADGIEFVERAIRVSTDDEALAADLLAVARDLYDRGEFVFASRYGHLAARSRQPSLAVRARTLDVEITFTRRQTLPPHLVNSWSKQELRDAPADVARLQLLLSIGRCDRGEYAEAEELLTAARDAGDHLGDAEDQLLDAATIRLEAARGRDETALRCFTALRTGEIEECEPHFVLAVATGLMLTEHYESAQAALALLRGEVDRATIWRTRALGLQAEIALRAGSLRRASELIDDIGLATAGAGQVRPDRILQLRCWQLLMRGEACAAEPLEAELAALAATTDNRRLLAELNALQGSCLLRLGYPAEAVRHLRRCDELSTHELNPNVRRHEADLIEALIEIGRREHAGMLVAQLRRRVERCPSRWAEHALRRCEALLAAGEKSLELFTLALRAFRSEDSLYEKALTQLAFSRRLSGIGAQARAREQLSVASATFLELGADGLARHHTAPPAPVETAASELPQLRELSDEELKVVELVRAGLKNKEIARRVFVSLRTVELRLTAAYRKLGVGSRTELISRLAGNPSLAVV